MFKRILVAVDGSPTAQRGLDAGIALAVDQRAVLLVLHVFDNLSHLAPQYNTTTAPYIGAYVDTMRANGRKILDDAERLARTRRVEVETALVGSRRRSVARAILDHAQVLRADVIVLGTHGRRGVERLLLGSDAEAVLRESPVPVLTVRVHEPTAGRVAQAALTHAQRQFRREPAKRPAALRIESSQ